MFNETIIDRLYFTRQCKSDKVRYQDGDPHPYCVDGCKQTTMCGDTLVPEEHLDVSVHASAFVFHTKYSDFD